MAVKNEGAYKNIESKSKQKKPYEFQYNFQKYIDKFTMESDSKLFDRSINRKSLISKNKQVN